jgi:immune inhibitor A
MNKYTVYSLIFFLLLMNHSSKAVPAYPHPIKTTQSDGTELTIRLKGDEFFHYHTTEDGYLIQRDEKGIFHYTTRTKTGSYQRSQTRVTDVSKRNISERNFVKTLTPHPNFRKENLSNRALRAPSSSDEPQKIYPRTGSPKSLVILVNFADISFTIPDPQTAFHKLLNEPNYSTNGATGSARDYFRDNSMGVFDPTFDVVGPFTLPQPTSFYGENSSGFDKNPRQMVVDACTLANPYVDFAQYDTDNDGIIDNVFIYYAGYNEAEGAPATTIWPHRWTLANKTTKFDNKILYEYACTSELRGNSGGKMCGIGTFCHEFGHVLGLVDYYDTEDTNQYTMGNWNIMDEGAYNNEGRTPPAYSAYDRFYLNWLIPTEIKTPNQYTLDTLTTSNKAYIITANGNHNLDGANPNPVEFFTLENRQKIGWDTYLPGHGMLITRIYYNPTTWAKNAPNNDIKAMGVDIMEADGIANNTTKSGDPFPGTKNIQYYNPVLRDGTLIGKSITDITEDNGIISFFFKEGISTSTSEDTTNEMNTVENVFSRRNDGTAIISTPNKTDIITIYNSIGKKIYGPTKPSSTTLEIYDLPRQQVLIIQIGNKRMKTIL